MKGIDWHEVLDYLRDELTGLMRGERMFYPEEERNPYTFQIFDMQEIIGSIEREDYDDAYRLLVENYGEEFFEDFLL